VAEHPTLGLFAFSSIPLEKASKLPNLKVQENLSPIGVPLVKRAKIGHYARTGGHAYLAPPCEMINKKFLLCTQCGTISMTIKTLI
jgi:hypothetical protein